MTGTNNIKPFCAVPFAEAFSGTASAFRNCCVADPQIVSDPGQTFAEWWTDKRLQDFRNRMHTTEWPSECYRCRIQEQQSGQSLRTVVNQSVDYEKSFGSWPSRWNLKFGNVCNLACWSCNENFSSTIAQHKRSLGILSLDFADPQQEFESHWPELEQCVLKSYQLHDVVTLTLAGGEPLFNKTVLQFLTKLIELGLAPRTRLEFHTNATRTGANLFANNTWNHVCVFLSLDAVDSKAEWLRYGSDWNQIKKNVDFFKTAADYVEVHCTVSILNIKDLPALSQFCKSHQLPLKIDLVSNPWFMSIVKWPKNPALIADRDQLDQHGLECYYDLIGTQADSGCVAKLVEYITQFDKIRASLATCDPELYKNLINQ